jgi:uncharacterized protein
MTAQLFQPIYQGRDFYVPAFDIKIRGVELPAWARKDFMEVRYTDKVGEIDSFEITINNWDAKEQDFKYTGSWKDTEGNDFEYPPSQDDAVDKQSRTRKTLFLPGSTIELRMGYFKPVQTDEQPLHLMLAGIITRLTPNFPASGQPTLKIAGQNILRKLITKQETHYYSPDKFPKDSDIALEIGRKGNLKIDDLEIPIRINPESKANNEAFNKETVLQDNQFDILFLLQLAHRNDYDIFLKYENEQNALNPYLYFGPSTKEPRVSYLLEWGKSLIQFQPTLTTTNQVSKLVVRGWNPKKKEKIEETIDIKQIKTRGVQDEALQNKINEGFTEHQEVIVDHPIYSKEEAKKYAEARLTELVKNMVTARGSTIGIPDLRAGSFIKIDKLGNTFNGRYFVTSTTHTIGTNGYITEFEARKEEKNG